MAEVLRQGFAILVPFGENNSYDFVAERGGAFLRVQCKTGRLVKGAVVFNTTKSFKNAAYSKNAFEMFATYCPQTGDIFFVRKGECGTGHKMIRVQPAKNHQAKGVNESKRYRTLAGIAQLAEHPTCNRKVARSSRAPGSKNRCGMCPPSRHCNGGCYEY
jgi:PD-(D/E)XK endonuclease